MSSLATTASNIDEYLKEAQQHLATARTALEQADRRLTWIQSRQDELWAENERLREELTQAGKEV